MGLYARLFHVTFVILVLHYVRAQEIFDEISRDGWGHLTKIPRKFEIHAENAATDFKKYANDIQDLTAGKNMSIVYLVRVERLDTASRIAKKRKMHKKVRSKKYNVPLKKQNMKLSNFEVLLRKLAEENRQKLPNYEIAAMMSTDKPEKLASTKQILLKYKPIRRLVKTNYTKVITPVRNKIITLT